MAPEPNEPAPRALPKGIDPVPQTPGRVLKQVRRILTSREHKQQAANTARSRAAAAKRQLDQTAARVAAAQAIAIAEERGDVVETVVLS